MRNVAARARVKVDGCVGVFLVMSVDRDRQTANLIPVDDGEIEEDVPFSRIRPLNGDAPEMDPTSVRAIPEKTARNGTEPLTHASLNGRYRHD